MYEYIKSSSPKHNLHRIIMFLEWCISYFAKERFFCVCTSYKNCVKRKDTSCSPLGCCCNSMDFWYGHETIRELWFYLKEKIKKIPNDGFVSSCPCDQWTLAICKMCFALNNSLWLQLHGSPRTGHIKNSSLNLWQSIISCNCDMYRR